MSSKATNSDPEAALQSQLVAFIRAFGLHKPEQTPCGQPISVAEAHALIEIDRIAGLSQTDLAARLLLEKSTVSRLVQHLVARGWIERRPHPADGRIRLLYLTPAGSRLVHDLAQARREKFARILAALPADKQPEILDALTLLTDAIRESS